MIPARFDVVVIGAGPAGYAAAMRAHDLGKTVLLVEKDRVGGTGIHEGALSSKTMWHLSNDYALACRTDRGFRAASVEVRYAEVMASVRAAVRERRELLEQQIARLGAPSPRGGRVVLERGAARLVGPHAVEVKGEGGSLRLFEADNFVICTGSKPRVPDGIVVDGHHIVTSDHIERWDRFPESLVVVGAGVVGCEYATVFANFGKTRINVIDRQPRILPFEDDDVASCVAQNFEEMGITIHRESQLLSMEVKDGRVAYVIETPRGRETIHVEHALISIGRVPNTAGLGLSEVGVQLDRGGGVVVEQTRSTVPHIYAAGDTSMDIALVNVAELEGRHAAEMMSGLSPQPIRYEALSAIMFLKPEVASVGLNEQQARKKGVPYRVAVLDNRLINRNIAMRDTDGFVKLLASRDGHRVLGLRVVGPEASSCIQGIAFLIDQQATLEDIDRCVHPHPAITEGVQECARMLLGRSVHKVEVFAEDLLRCGEG